MYDDKLEIPRGHVTLPSVVMPNANIIKSAQWPVNSHQERVDTAAPEYRPFVGIEQPVVCLIIITVYNNSHFGVGGGLFSVTSVHSDLIEIVVAEQIVLEDNDAEPLLILAIFPDGPDQEEYVKAHTDYDGRVDDGIVEWRGVGDHVREVDAVGQDDQTASELGQVSRLA